MSKSPDQILGEMSTVFRRVLDDDSITLKRETTANDVKNWDSLNHIELVMATEKHFNIRFNFAELQKFRNVGEMCDNIITKLGAAAK